LGKTSGDKEAPKETKDKQTNLEYESEVVEMAMIQEKDVMNSTMCDFKDYVRSIEVMDIHSTGLHFTWNQKPRGRNGVLNKLDRIKVTQKMKIIKKPLRKLMHDHGNLRERVNQLRLELDEDFNEANIDEERFLRQKAKIDWLEGEGLFNKKVSDGSNMQMIRPITNAEIKTAMFDIGNDKAPRPDGYTSMFFKKGWDVVDADVCKVIHDFFSNGKIRKEINHTFMALIPKIATPQKVNEYRPISCCNVIYKCISKILTNCIIEGIKEVVSENQSAFVLGKRIPDNILLTQELMHNYHLKRRSPRCRGDQRSKTGPDRLGPDRTETEMV
ncbi:protein LAZ1, partial [Tanacetum coccineum]